MKSNKQLFLMLVLALMFAGCEKDYNYVAPPVDNDAPPPAVLVSFKNDIQPIFDASCNQSGCHDGNSYDPDLTAANAYDAIINTACIDTTNPAGSLLYVRLILPTTDKKFMPKGAGPLSATDITKILNWIKQGGQNN